MRIKLKFWCSICKEYKDSELLPGDPLLCSECGEEYFYFFNEYTRQCEISPSPMAR